MAEIVIQKDNPTPAFYGIAPADLVRLEELARDVDPDKTWDHYYNDEDYEAFRQQIEDLEGFRKSVLATLRTAKTVHVFND